MDLDVVLLGTSARQPTPGHAVASLVVARGGEHVLVDCGEGTQTQMLRSWVGLGHLRAVVLTHVHGDHVLGLPGLLATYSTARTQALVVCGPPGVAAAVAAFRPWFGPTAFPLEVREMSPGDALDLDGWRVRAVAADHVVPALGWAFEEDPLPGHLDRAAARGRGAEGPDLAVLAAGGDVPAPGGGRIRAAEVTGPPRRGRRVVVSGDTAPTAPMEAAARGADLLVHEATFLERHAALARASGHSTAAGAAGVAARAGVRLLALTHRSRRYATADVLAEAAGVYPAVVAPRDLDLVRVPLPERGAPRLVPGGGRRGPQASRGEAGGGHG